MIQNIRKKIQGNDEMMDGLELLLVLINSLTSPVKDRWSSRY
jgi:hypothetical protein